MGQAVPVSQRMVAERRDPRITLAPPAVDVYPNGPFAMPAGYMVAPRPSDCVPWNLQSYGVAAYKYSGRSMYRLHFCSGGPWDLNELKRYARDLKQGRLTTIRTQAPVMAILVAKDRHPRDLYTVAKNVKTKLMSYDEYCDIIDVMFMCIDLHQAGRMSASEAFRLAQMAAAY